MKIDLSLLNGSALHPALVRWMAQTAHQGVFATDASFRIILWNHWMEVHSHRPASEAIGQPLFDLYPPDERELMHDYYAGALQGHVTIVSHGLHRHVLPLPPTSPELPFDHMPQAGQIAPLLHDNQVVGTVTVIEDVSDRLGAERALRKQIEAQKQARLTAEQALRAKDDFLSTLSHEIRTPLNAVLGWTRILISREQVDRALLERALTIIERNASAQAKLIDDMLDMARIVAGKLRLELKPVDLAGVVTSAVDVVAPEALSKQIALRTHLEPSMPPVLGDRDRLEQVVWNLLSNAFKFTPAGGSIDVRMSMAHRFVSIEVRDSGQGIRSEFLPYVFDRFRQSDPSSTRRSGGLGLGLGLVRELVELHGGTVRADSPGEGMGSTFTISLPVMSAPLNAEVRGKAVARNAPSLRGIRVLLVEDERDARELAQLALEQAGAHVTAVSSVTEALASLAAMAQGNLADVIVSDIAMAGQDGYSLIKKVRSLAPEQGGKIPALSVTGFASPDDVRRALKAGFQMHMAKPLDPQALVAAVARLVTLR